jgi:hypothetical protein
VSADREPGAVADGTVVTCPSCRLDFDDFADAGEAQYFAAGHNDLHAHGARLAAFTVDTDDEQDRASGSRAGEAGQTPAVAGLVDEDGW